MLGSTRRCYVNGGGSDELLLLLLLLCSNPVNGTILLIADRVERSDDDHDQSGSDGLLLFLFEFLLLLCRERKSLRYHIADRIERTDKDDDKSGSGSGSDELLLLLLVLGSNLKQYRIAD